MKNLLIVTIIIAGIINNCSGMSLLKEHTVQTKTYIGMLPPSCYTQETHNFLNIVQGKDEALNKPILHSYLNERISTAELYNPEARPNVADDELHPENISQEKSADNQETRIKYYFQSKVTDFHIHALQKQLNCFCPEQVELTDFEKSYEPKLQSVDWASFQKKVEDAGQDKIVELLLAESYTFANVIRNKIQEEDSQIKKYINKFIY